MFRAIERNAKTIGLSLGVLMISLIALYFLLNLAANKAPSPIAGLAKTLGQRATGSNYSF